MNSNSPGLVGHGVHFFRDAPANASRHSQKNPTESAATLVRRGGCLRSCGLFNGNRVCAVDEAIEAHSLNCHAPGSAQRHAVLH